MRRVQNSRLRQDVELLFHPLYHSIHLHEGACVRYSATRPKSVEAMARCKVTALLPTYTVHSVVSHERRDVT